MNLQEGPLTIRDATIEDARQLTIWWNDGKVMEHAGFPLGLNTTEEETIQSIQKNNEDRNRLIIRYHDTRIGEMSYHKVEKEIVEIGIKICDTNYQEKGLGRVLLSMMIQELFHIGYQKVILDTNLNNTRAQHVYEKLGFKKVSIRENAWKDQVGIMQSIVDYELTKENFHPYHL